MGEGGGGRELDGGELAMIRGQLISRLHMQRAKQRA